MSANMSALHNYKRSTIVLSIRPPSPKRIKLNSNSDWISPTRPAVIPANKRRQPIEIALQYEKDYKKRFKETLKLGKGTYGRVVRATDKQTGTSVVVKSFLKKKVFNWTNGIPTEIDMMMSMNHENIAPVLEAFQSRVNFRMTMPDTNGKDLVKRLLKTIEVRSLPSLPYIAHEVGKGLRYLHEDCSIVHLDIKPGNIIVSKNGADGYKVQIIDFGCAKRYSKGVKEFVVDGGTHRFSCKELYTGTKIIGPEADIFSFGVLVYMLYFDHEKPFPEISDIQSEDEVKLPEELNVPEKSALRELLLNTLTKDTANRWTIRQVLSSEWMKQNGFKSWFI